MALRDQPYLPLYVQDYLTDEKLNECGAESQGVYIKLMCIMHKSEEYGTILLKQKDKQNTEQIKNFACKLVKQIPFQIEVIERALEELLDEKVLYIDNDKLCQKRMIKDNDISEKRALAGKKGYNTKHKKSKNNNDFAEVKQQATTKRFAKAKAQANSEYEYEYENETKDVNKNINIKTLYYSDKELNNLFYEFLELRKKIKAQNTDRAIGLLLNELNKHDDETKKEMLKQSIMNSWKSVYPLKNNSPPSKNKNNPFLECAKEAYENAK